MTITRRVVKADPLKLFAPQVDVVVPFPPKNPSETRAIAAILERSANANSFEYMRRQVYRGATGILAANGYRGFNTVTLKGVADLRKKMGTIVPYSPVDYAIHVLQLLCQISPSATPDLSMALAYQAGLCWREFELRNGWKANADSGRRSREGARAGRRKALDATASSRSQRNAKIQVIAVELRRAHPTVSDRALAKTIAPKVKCSESTVRRVLGMPAHKPLKSHQ
jgi:hypothetical protein